MNKLENEVRAVLVKYEDHLNEWEQKFLSGEKLHIHPPLAFDILYEQILTETFAIRNAELEAQLDNEEIKEEEEEEDDDEDDKLIEDFSEVAKLAMHKAVMFVLELNKRSHKKYHQYTRCTCFELSDQDLKNLLESRSA